jgi:hypothetical protein
MIKLLVGGWRWAPWRDIAFHLREEGGRAQGKSKERNNDGIGREAGREARSAISTALWLCCDP